MKKELTEKMFNEMLEQTNIELEKSKKASENMTYDEKMEAFEKFKRLYNVKFIEE